MALEPTQSGWNRRAVPDSPQLVWCRNRDAAVSAIWLGANRIKLLMARSHEEHRASKDETSEEAPKVQDADLLPPERKGRKKLGPRWNPMNAVYGDSTAPDFPKIS
jgi:hypothetical protein